MAERYEWGKCLLEAEWAPYSAAHQPFGTIACTTHGALAGLLKGLPRERFSPYVETGQAKVLRGFEPLMRVGRCSGPQRSFCCRGRVSAPGP
jgi:hypothetical protein